MKRDAVIYRFFVFTIKVIIIHTLTYFIFGLIFSNLFNYAELFRQEVIRDFMHPIDSSAVLLGPFIQPLRGLVFAVGLWPIKEFLLKLKYGWLILWNIIIVFGIVSTPAASPCSIEGLIYTKLPFLYHVIGLPEILLQTLAFSVVLIWWLKRSEQDTKTRSIGKKRAILMRLMLVVSIACYGYVGYAIGAILSAQLAGKGMHIRSTSVTLSSQMMFIVAFIMNFGIVFLLSAKQFLNRINFRWIFLLFLFADTSIVLIYQFVFSYMMPLHLALLIGFFPALIIAISLRLNHKNFDRLNHPHS